MSAVFTPGQSVIWRHQPRGGYGIVIPVLATVVRVGPRTIRIEAELRAGGTKQVNVKPASIRPTQAQLFCDGSVT